MFVYAYENYMHVPDNLLLKQIHEVKLMNIGEIKEEVYEDEPEDLIVPMNWMLIYPNGHFISLHVENGVIETLVITDSFFKTKKNIRVGDNLEKIISIDSGAEFEGGSSEVVNVNSLLGVVLYSKDKKIIYRFEYDKEIVSAMLHKEKIYTVKDKKIKSLKLWGMYIKASSWEK